MPFTAFHASSESLASGDFVSGARSCSAAGTKSPKVTAAHIILLCSRDRRSHPHPNEMPQHHEMQTGRCTLRLAKNVEAASRGRKP